MLHLPWLRSVVQLRYAFEQFIHSCCPAYTAAEDFKQKKTCLCFPQLMCRQNHALPRRMEYILPMRYRDMMAIVVHSPKPMKYMTAATCTQHFAS